MFVDDQQISMSIEKSVLLDKLRSNRASHLATYQEACAGYLVSAAKALKAKMKSIKEGKVISLSTGLVMPVQQLKQYETGIAMLQMTTDEHVTLTQAQFENYVLDQWSWKTSFLTTNASYSS